MIAMSAFKRAGTGLLTPVARALASKFLSGVAASTPPALLLALSLFATSAFALPLSGTKNIPGDYANLAAAITDLNTEGVAAPGVTLNLLAGNAQTAPLGGYAVTTLTGLSTAPIVIQGNGNTVTAPVGQVLGNLNDAIFKIIGTDYVTIAGFTMTENVANTTTAAATNNMTEWGVALLYTTATDNSQNITIQNNTIDLDRTYQNTFGIYANATHTAAAVTTSASATGAAGGNNNLKIYSNTITDVNIGIVVIGPTAAADLNDGLDIGGASALTGNTITNFGTTPTFSSYANVSGTVNGILIRNNKNYNVSRNTITSSNGGMAVSGTMNGIQVVASSASPTGTLTQTVNDNTLSLRPGVAGATISAINMPGTTSVNATTTNSVNNNNFNTFGHTVAATGAVNFVIQGGNPLAQNINGNTFTNLSVNTTGAVTFFSVAPSFISGASLSISNNQVVTGFTRTGVGTTTVWSSNASSVTGSTHAINNNSFSNITLTGASAFNGILDTDGASSTSAPLKSVNGNTFSNITTGAGTVVPMSVNYGAPGSTVSNNTISSITTGNSINALLLGANFQSTMTAAGSSIGPITSGGASVVGISIASFGAVISKSKIYDLSGTLATSVVSGITITSATASSTVTLSNNLIGNLTAPIATGTNGVIGVNITGTATTSTYNLFYNTIYLNNATSGVGFGSSGISALASATGTTSALNLRNNVIVNTSVQNGAGLTVAYRRSLGTAGTLANYASTSNNNDFYAGTPGVNNLIYSDGTSSAQTIAAYKGGTFTAGTVAPRDSSSVSESPNFISTVGSNANFLHISSATATQLESGGAPIAGITDDFDGNVRNASTPDIGADEFNGILLDLSPPVIAYAPLGNTASTGARTLTATITDATGVPTSGAGLPVLYWRINAGSYAPAAATSLGSNQYSFSFGAGVTTGDVVSYYIAAQDTAVTPNVGTSPSAGAAGFSANPPAASTPPTTPSSYNIAVPVSGNLNVGTAESFTSLTRNDAQGIFKYINDNVITGNLVINVTSDLLIEDGAVALNEFAAPFTVTIKPDGGVRNVIGAAASTALIRLNGASRVTFDGSVSGGTDRSLYIENTSGTSPTVFRLGSVGTTPIVGNTIKNCTIRNGANTASAITLTDTAGALAGYFNNITIQNNDIQKAFRGIFANAIASGTNGSGLLITGNALNTAGVNSIRLNPIFVAGANGVTISNNTLGNISNANAEVPVGIQVSTGTDNAVVSGNTLTSIVSTSTGAASVSGILISAGTTATNIAVSNNTITTLTSAGTAANFYAIGSFSPNVAISDNVISGMTQTGAASGLGIVLVGVNNNVVSGNSVSALTISGGSSVTSGIQAQGASTNVTIERNKVFNIKNTNTAGWGANGIQLASSSAVANTTVRNNFVYDVAAYGFADVTAVDNGYGMIVSSGAGYNIYSNSVLMGTNQTATTGLPAAFNVTSGVTAAGAVNVRNNVFVTTQTVGTQRYAIYSGAPNTVYAAIDYNDYVSAGPNLGFIGSARATLADIVAGFGGNAGSISADPVFVSPTDLHLQASPLSPLESAGTPIASVTNDIDNDPRPATKPDIGADELTSNLTISPATVAFGNLPINTTSAELTVTLSNTGAGSLDVTTLDAAAAPFARTGTGTCPATLPITIAPGANCTLTYTFAPTVAGAASQTLTVTSNGPGSGTIALTGTGTQGNLTITPTSVAFGNQLVGSTSSEMTVTLANTGNASLNVTALSAAAAPFTQTGTGTCGSVPITLAASGTCTLTYTYSPTATGPATQTLTVTANAPGSGSIALSGTGIQGSLTISPASIAFGNVAVGSNSGPTAVTLANSGSAPLTVTALTTANAPFSRVGGNCSAVPITIAAGSSCTVAYQFVPTATGAFSQTLTVTADAPGSGTIALSGTGVQGALTISPASVPFGNQAVGSTSGAMTVTLGNSGGAPLQVTALTPAAAPFALSGGSCGGVPITIPASGTCTLTYTFAPTVAGAANQTLTVTANVPGSGTIALSGTGTQGTLTITPPSVNFGTRTLNTTSPETTVILANTGNSSLDVTVLTPAAAPFTRTATGTCSASLPITIPSSGSCTLTYTFTPTVTGPANQTLTVTTSGSGSGTIALAGTGAGPGGVCSTGQPIEVSATAATPGPTGYATLKAGFDAINGGVHQGGIQMSVCADTTETATATLNASGVGPAVYTSVLVSPANGAARSITGSLAAPLVDLNGADNVTIDGLNIGGNALTLTNTSTSNVAGTSTIRFIDGATGNRVTNSTILGSSLVTLPTAGGTVYFATDAITPNGNDTNTISNNNIGPASAGLPIKAVFGLGTLTALANSNSGVVIDNNNIYDFFGTGAASVSGVNVLGGNDNWTISNNRIYQTAPRVFTGTVLRYAGITLNSSGTFLGTFIVAGNRIGFGAANGTGTTTISGSTNTVRGIDAPSVGVATPTSIQGNTISGINQTTASVGTGTTTQFIGMMLGSTGGRFDVGDLVGNTIGSLDGSSTIVINVSAGTGSVTGMYDFSLSANTISNTSIGAITIQGTATTVGFRGILVNTGTGLTLTLTNNTIGGPTAAGGITNSLVGANSQYAVQITSSNVIATGNTIRNLTANSTTVNGIVISGLLMTGSTGTSTIARNTVHSLTNNAGVASNSIYAIYTSFGAASNSIVEQNLVHSLVVNSTATTSQMVGILPVAGSATYRNNMVRLGLTAAGASITPGYVFYGMFEIAGTNNIYNNSVYLGGTGVVSASSTFAFVSNVATGTRNIQDNIFWNARSNASGVGSHYAISVPGTAPNPVGLTSNYNDLFASGTGGFVGRFNAIDLATLADWQAATGQDANSFSEDPKFIAPNGTAATGDLHINPSVATPIEGTGLAIAAVTNDFDGDVRASFTPTDVGADAGNFIAQVGNLTISPTSVPFGNVVVGATSTEATVTLGNSGTGSLQVTALSAATTPFARTGTGTCSATLPITIVAGGSCTLTYTFSPTATGPASQSLTVTANVPGSGTIALSGTGIQGNLTITPATIAFGNVAVGSNSGPTAVSLANTGSAPLVITALTDATAPFSRVGGSCSAVPITIPAGGNCSVAYQFAPTATGAASQTLTVTANAPGSGTITLTGTGTQGALVINPTTVAFGNQAVGSTSSAQTVTLTNTGDASLNVTVLTAATSPFARLAGSCGTTAPFAIAAGTSCTLTYTFAPTSTGAASQTLTVTANVPGSGTITLSGTGTQGTLVINPTAVAFGNQSVGTTSTAQTVTLSNTGDASLNVTALTAATSPFARSGGSCGTAPFAIAAGASCTLTYTFAPNAAGAASQTLTVTSNAPGSGTITLSGTGVQGNLVISPPTVDFGSPDILTTTPFMSVTLSNTGVGSLQVTSLTLAAAPFVRTADGSCGNSLPITIAAGASCTITYTFAPTTAGSQSQTFNVTTTSPGSGSFTLTGIGVSDRIFMNGFDSPL